MAARYGHYLQDIRKPDLATLVRICRVLGLRLDMLLACDQADPAPDAVMAKRAAVAAYVDVLDAGSLDLALPVVQAIAATAGLRSSMKQAPPLCQEQACPPAAWAPPALAAASVMYSHLVVLPW